MFTSFFLSLALYLPISVILFYSIVTPKASQAETNKLRYFTKERQAHFHIYTTCQYQKAEPLVSFVPSPFVHIFLHLEIHQNCRTLVSPQVGFYPQLWYRSDVYPHLNCATDPHCLHLPIRFILRYVEGGKFVLHLASCSGWIPEVHSISTDVTTLLWYTAWRSSRILCLSVERDVCNYMGGEGERMRGQRLYIYHGGGGDRSEEKYGCIQILINLIFFLLSSNPRYLNG